MGLRSKLLIPFLIALIILYGVIHYYWIPQLLENEQLKIKAREVAVVKALQPMIIRSYLARDFANLYVSLNLNKESNPHWVNLVFQDDTGKQLYPLTEKSILEGEYLIAIKQDIGWEGDSIGKIILIVSCLAPPGWVDLRASRLYDAATYL